MLKIGVLGIGNAGNQVAALAKKMKSIPSIALNASEKDVDAIKTDINGIVFGNREGCGKDRTLAKTFVKTNIKDLLGRDVFINFMNEVDIVFVTNSTGGGSGSGMAPIITDILRSYYAHQKTDEKPKMFINIGILPTLGESVGAQRNTVEYLKEMVDLGGSYMLFDNDAQSGKSPAEMMKKINSDIVNMLSVIRGDRSHATPYGMIDDKDMTKIISQPGLIFMNILEDIYEEKLPANGSIEDLLIDNINKNSCMSKIDRDKIVKRMGFIANLSPEMHKYFNEDLPKVRETFGEPIEDFKHFAENTEGDELNSLVLLMSGLSIPDNRIKTIIHRIEAVEEALKKQKQSSLLDSAMEKASEFSGTTENSSSADTDFDLDSITDKY